MIPFENSIIDLIRQRFSCRSFLEEPISDDKLQKLLDFIRTLPAGPFGRKGNFHVVSASHQDPQMLHSLGTYGFIKGASGFIIGTVAESPYDLEDFGYQMEKIILFATSLQLGTCWLGGSFTRSSFALKINASETDIIPAVTAIGEIENQEKARKGLLRRQIKADQRLDWNQLFFENGFEFQLTRQSAEIWETPLEMIRLGPSGSNKQPWRVVRNGDGWHFYLQRTKGYRENSLNRFLGIADIQRLDMGIAMCHFELTSQELGLQGHWRCQEPAIERPDPMTEYTISWVN